MLETVSKRMGKKQFIAKILEGNPQANKAKIEKAYDFAEEAHIGQMRQSGDQHFVHATEVALLVSEMKLDTDSICAALLHDTLEDTDVTEKELEKEFGKETLTLVAGVTKEAWSSSIQDYRAANIRKVLLATGKEPRVMMIKLADRLHNMRTLKYLPAQKQRTIAHETLEIYVPIAYKYGMYRFKVELEDLCLKHLQPTIYQHLKTKISRKKVQREKQVQKVVTSVRKLLGENGINAKVSGRAKNFYGIYKKMMKKGLRFEDIRDLLAIRVLVEKPEDCYKALEIIHSKWAPVESGFDDYIKNPKPNMYQSIHTDIEFDKQSIEVQIRTHRMHSVAEDGIAAHWQYKDTKRDKKFDQKIAWLKQILDWRRNDTANDLMESFRIDIFKDEIYAMTPKGDPIPLPENSTPVDFAFAVHSEIGNHCKAAKVNGEIQPLDYALESGDVVEIITAKNAKPSRQWLNFVKTGYARVKIRKSMGIIGENVRKKVVVTSTNLIQNPGNKPMKLQRCCYIREGEDIVGEVLKNVLRVHSRHCDQVDKIPKDKKVKLGWKHHTKKQQIEVQIKDRSGIFADILGTLTRGEVQVTSINTKSAKNSLKLSVNVDSSEEQIKKILPKVKSVEGVISARAG